MTAPFPYRLLNLLRRSLEDWRSPERSRVEVVAALFQQPVKRKSNVLPINLLVHRGQRKRVA